MIMHKPAQSLIKCKLTNCGFHNDWQSIYWMLIFLRKTLDLFYTEITKTMHDIDY